MKLVHEMIDEADLEIVLADFDARCDAPTLTKCDRLPETDQART